MHILRPMLPTKGHRHCDESARKAGTFREMVAEQLDHESRVCSGFHSVNHTMEGVEFGVALRWGSR
jgi:hypothetical protein